MVTRACARLPEDAALVKFVAYQRTPRGAPGTLEPAHAALVVRGAGCEVQRVSLAGGDSIERAAEAFAAAMRAERADDPKSRAALAEQVLAPLSSAVGEAQRWFVIPDGSLWGVPLGCAAIFGFNVLRIATLLVVGRYWSDYFDFFHIYFWQATLIAMIVSVLYGWIKLFVPR